MGLESHIVGLISQHVVSAFRGLKLPTPVDVDAGLPLHVVHLLRVLVGVPEHVSGVSRGDADGKHQHENLKSKWAFLQMAEFSLL